MLTAHSLLMHKPQGPSAHPDACPYLKRSEQLDGQHVVGLHLVQRRGIAAQGREQGRVCTTERAGVRRTVQPAQHATAAIARPAGTHSSKGEFCTSSAENPAHGSP